jgi:hypothetical protein
MPDRPDLEALLRRAVAARDAMSPAERAEHDEAQRQSWTRAMEPCEHGVREGVSGVSGGVWGARERADGR